MTHHQLVTISNSNRDYLSTPRRLNKHQNHHHHRCTIISENLQTLINLSAHHLRVRVLNIMLFINIDQLLQHRRQFQPHRHLIIAVIIHPIICVDHRLLIIMIDYVLLEISINIHLAPLIMERPRLSKIILLVLDIEIPHYLQMSRELLQQIIVEVRLQVFHRVVVESGLFQRKQLL